MGRNKEVGPVGDEEVGQVGDEEGGQVGDEGAGQVGDEGWTRVTMLMGEQFSVLRRQKVREFVPLLFSDFY